MKITTVVEFVGIPYAGKTLTLNALDIVLRNEGKRTHVVEQYNGNSNFYAERKHSLDINLVRCLHQMQEIVQITGRRNSPDVILVDRGFFDTLCWISLFGDEQATSIATERLAWDFLTAIENYSERYRIVWIDRDPHDCVRAHGERPGTVVTNQNLTKLASIYSSRGTEVSGSHTTFHQITNDRRPAQLGIALHHLLKL